MNSRHPSSIALLLAGVLLSAPVFAHMRYDFGPWFIFYVVLIYLWPVILVVLLGLILGIFRLHSSLEYRKKQVAEDVSGRTKAAAVPVPAPLPGETGPEPQQHVPKRSSPAIGRYPSIRFRRALLSGLLVYGGGMLVVMLDIPVLAALLLVLAGFLPEWLGIATPVLDPMEQRAFWISFGPIPAIAAALLAGFWPSRNTG